MKKKRGQFFILAAVILSALVVSMVATKNYVNVNKKPQRFHDLTSEMKYESLRVIDYGIFTGNETLSNFIELSVDNWRNQDPGAEIRVMYGNEDNVIVMNYGKESVNVIGQEECSIDGGYSKSDSDITLSTEGSLLTKEVSQDLINFGAKCCVVVVVPEENIVIIEVSEQKYEFDLAQNQQFYLIAVKTLGEEAYVAVQ